MTWTLLYYDEPYHTTTTSWGYSCGLYYDPLPVVPLTPKPIPKGWRGYRNPQPGLTPPAVNAAPGRNTRPAQPTTRWRPRDRA